MNQRDDDVDKEHTFSNDRFSPGRLYITPGAADALAQAGLTALELLARHLSGDWGDVCEEDRAENELSLFEGFRLLSSYRLKGCAVILWIITESDRSATTILLPSEY